MTEMDHADSPTNVKEIVAAFLRLGATSYGGPAIMGVMQAELQERRHWVTKERFVEGLSLVNMLPGATATQLGIFLGYARGGWWGGLLGGVCFVFPAFLVMLALTMAYARLGVTPIVRDALYGLGPVVLGIFVMAIYRLGRSAASTLSQAVIAAAAALAVLATPLGIAPILVLAGAAGLLLFHSRRPSVIGAALVAIALAMLPSFVWAPSASGVARRIPDASSLVDIGAYFFEVGAFTVGGGLTMIAFIQQQVVEQFHWLTPREFIDGRARGPVTPGPVLMRAADGGDKIAGIAGAAVAAGAAFLPSFILMLVVLPMLDRIRRLAWTRAVLKGMGPAVIGILAVSLARIAPHALPDPVAVVILIATVIALSLRRIGPFRAMLGGAVLGLLRERLFGLPVRI